MELLQAFDNLRIELPEDEETETEEVEEVEKPLLRKMIRRDEYEFLLRARKMISELTGEDFTIETPEWYCGGGFRLEFDGFCDRLKMAINYDPVFIYQLPSGMEELADDIELYELLLEHIAETRLIRASMNGIAVIPLPGVMDDVALRKYLLDKLHELTKFRVWVGSPRCKCHPEIKEDEYKK